MYFSASFPIQCQTMLISLLIWTFLVNQLPYYNYLKHLYLLDYHLRGFTVLHLGLEYLELLPGSAIWPYVSALPKLTDNPQHGLHEYFVTVNMVLKH